MKAELDIDTEHLIKEIIEGVVKRIKPILEKGKAENDILFSVKNLSVYLDVSKEWVYERIHKNEIPFIKVGKFPRFKKSDIDKWLEKQKTPAVNPLPCSFKLIKRSAVK